MESDPTVAQRFGRVLEQVTRQSGPAVQHLRVRIPDPGQHQRKPGPAPGAHPGNPHLIIPTVNMVGIGVMVLLVTIAFPVPCVFTDVPLWLSTVVAPGLPPAVADHRNLVALHAHHQELRWSVEGRPPSRADQRNVFLIPWRISAAHLVLWGTGAILLTTLYGLEDRAFIPRLGLVIPFCGVLVATANYLFTEFALRPVAALALAAGPPPYRLAPGIMGRTITIWLLGSGLPLIGIGLAALFSMLIGNMTLHELEVAVLITVGLALVFGFCWSGSWRG